METLRTLSLAISILILSSAAFAQESPPEDSAFSATHPTDLPNAPGCENGRCDGAATAAAPAAVAPQVASDASAKGKSAAKPKLSDFFHVTIYQGLGVASNTEGKIKVDYANVSASIGKTPVQKVLYEHGLSGFKPGDWLINLNIKSSFLPWAMKNYVQSNAFANVAAGGAQEKTYITNQVTQGVTIGVYGDFLTQAQVPCPPPTVNGVAGSPTVASLGQCVQQYIASLPAPYQAPLQQQIQQGISTGISQTLPPLLQQLATGLAQEDHTLASRLTANDKENLYQDVNLMIGKVSKNGKQLYIADIGKFAPDTGAKVDEVGKTPLENMLLANSPVQTQSKPISTGAVDVGMVQRVGPVDVGVHVIDYHNRLNFTNNQDYISNVQGVDRISPNNQIVRLDSAVARLSIDGSRGEAYFSGGRVNNGVNGKETAIQAGGNYTFPTRTSVFADYSKNGSYLSPNAKSESFFVSQGLTGRLSVHGGVQDVRNSLSYASTTLPTNTISYREQDYGADINLVGNPKKPGHISWRLNVGGNCRKSEGGSLDAATQGCAPEADSQFKFSWH